MSLNDEGIDWAGMDRFLLKEMYFVNSSVLADSGLASGRCLFNLIGEKEKLMGVMRAYLWVSRHTELLCHTGSYRCYGPNCVPPTVKC